MIEERFGYFLSIATIAGIFYMIEKRSRLRFFDYVPAVVLIYITSMLFAQTGLWQQNDAMTQSYRDAKNALLPAMLFLLLLQLDIQTFVKLGKNVLIAFFGALFSIMASFVVIFVLFGFGEAQSGIFSALSGSWLGGTANMIAVGSAFNVSDTQMGYALIVDATAYTFWVMLLLMLVKLSSRFNGWTHASSSEKSSFLAGCACEMDSRNYILLLASVVAVTCIVQLIANWMVIINSATTMVLFATLFGLLGSFTKLSNLQGSSTLGNSILLLLVALIGSRAKLEGFGEVPLYITAGFAILTLHGVLMVIVAKVFRLDLFSISVASLSCIGGVASAPILAASYHKNLVGLAVLLAVMGYLLGTVGGLIVGTLLELIR